MLRTRGLTVGRVDSGFGVAGASPGKTLGDFPGELIVEDRGLLGLGKLALELGLAELGLEGRHSLAQALVELRFLELFDEDRTDLVARRRGRASA